MQIRILQTLIKKYHGDNSEEAKYPTVYEKVGEQENGYDCGILLLKHMEYKLNPKIFSPVDPKRTKEYRRRIAAGLIQDAVIL